MKKWTFNTNSSFVEALPPTSQLTMLAKARRGLVKPRIDKENPQVSILKWYSLRATSSVQKKQKAEKEIVHTTALNKKTRGQTTDDTNDNRWYEIPSEKWQNLQKMTSMAKCEKLRENLQKMHRLFQNFWPKQTSAHRDIWVDLSIRKMTNISFIMLPTFAKPKFMHFRLLLLTSWPDLQACQKLRCPSKNDIKN